MRAAVNRGGSIELIDLPRPAIGPDDALLRIEAAGVCGSDIAAYAAGERKDYVMGHENVGVVEEIGDIVASRWGVRAGDRVLVEEYIPCHHCEFCHIGEYRLCFATDHRQNPNAVRFGRSKVDRGPGLWGGFSEYLFLPGNSVVHPLPDDVVARHATLALPIGNGIQWVNLDGRAGPGSSVLILGPGQQGLGCVVAAVSSGARRVIVSGLEVDQPRLRAAMSLGASLAVDVDNQDLQEAVFEATDGRGVDTVVDTTSASTDDTAQLALSVLKRKGGTVLLHGSGAQTVSNYPLGLMASKYATVRVTRGHSYAAVGKALEVIRSGKFDLDLVATTEFGMDDVDKALTSATRDRSVIHVSVIPWKI